MIIDNLTARKILNSRNEQTIAVVVETKDGKFEASAPGGKSKGKNEAVPFPKQGVDFSVDFINALGKKLVLNRIPFREISDLEKLELVIRGYDNTKDYSKIGANTLYALEAALMKAISGSYGLSLWKFLNDKPKILPMPLGNCIGGGQHTKKIGGFEEKKTDFQEFLFLPKTKYFFDAYFINLQAYKETKKLLQEEDKEWTGELTDENAFSSTLDNESVLKLLTKTTGIIKDKFKIDLGLGLDVAASTFWNGANYSYKNFPSQNRLVGDKQIEYIVDLIKRYNLVYVEDPLEQEDFSGFSKLRRVLTGVNNKKCLIVGDDLICTQEDRLKKAIEEKSINAVIIKPNQNGSILATKRVVDLAKKNDIVPIISHRSGETSDNTIAQLAVGWEIPIIKTGILGKERFAKLHEILRIERSSKLK